MNLVRGQQMVGVRHGIDVIQVYCDTLHSAWRRISKYWDTNPLYVSCPFRYSSSKRCQEYYIDRIWYDSDSPKFENCLLDLKKLQRFILPLNGDAIGLVTRKPALHLHIPIVPEWMDSYRIEKMILVKRKIVAACGLRTIDWGGFADMAKLPRLPNSLSCPDNYVIQVYDGEWPDEILKARKQRRAYRSRKSQISLDDLLFALKDIVPANTPLTHKEATAVDMTHVQIKPATWVFEKPCLQLAMSLDSPPAFMRHESVVRLKKMGWSKKLIKLWFKGLAPIDYKADRTSYMVDSSYEYEWASSCNTIDFNGACIGPACPFYNYRTGVKKQ